MPEKHTFLTVKMKILSFATSAALAALVAASSLGAAAGQQTAALPAPKHKKGGCRKNMMMAKACDAAAVPAPTKRPTKKPFVAKVPARPTKAPTKRPTRFPTAPPTNLPTSAPTATPTLRPTQRPTVAPTPVPLPTTCPGVDGTMIPFQGHVYGYVSLVKSWGVADAYARSLECCSKAGHLVTVASLGEKAILETVLKTKVPDGTTVWFGMYVEGGKWVWTGAEGDVDTVGIMTEYSGIAYADQGGNVNGYAGFVGYGSSSRTYTPFITYGSMVEFDCY